MAKSALWEKADAVPTRLMGQSAVKTMAKGVFAEMHAEPEGGLAGA
ncbi:MAG: hypothetical protein ACR2IG_09715 [Roseomonas sp.]